MWRRTGVRQRNPFRKRLGVSIVRQQLAKNGADQSDRFSFAAGISTTCRDHLGLSNSSRRECYS